MWVAGLITSGAAAFGRLFAVIVLPSLVLTVGLWLPIRSKAFATRGLTLSQFVPTDLRVDASGLLLLLIVVVIVGALSQTFQIGLVRLLEGYWGVSRPASVVASARIRRHQARLTRLDVEARTDRKPVPVDVSKPMREQATHLRRESRRLALHQRAVQRVCDYPPDGDLLPTRLGNVLRSAESRAGERYGWPTVHTWPRLYNFMSDRLSSAYHASVDAMDAAVNLTIAFAIVAFAYLIAFWNDPGLYLVVIAMGAGSIISYRGAIAAAGMHGVLLHVAFDLHRFDMLSGLHHKLPDTAEEENAQATEVAEIFDPRRHKDGAVESWPNIRYSHPTTKADNGKAGTAEATN